MEEMSAFALPELNKDSLASRLLELKGGMYTSNICVLPWNILVQKLATLGLFPLDVGGDGSCFLEPVRIRCLSNQKAIMKFGWLVLIIYLTIQNSTLKVSRVTAGKVTLLKCLNHRHGVII